MCGGGGYEDLSLWQINTRRKVPSRVIFLDDDILTLTSLTLSFYHCSIYSAIATDFKLEQPADSFFLKSSLPLLTYSWLLTSSPHLYYLSRSNELSKVPWTSNVSPAAALFPSTPSCPLSCLLSSKLQSLFSWKLGPFLGATVSSISNRLSPFLQHVLLPELPLFFLSYLWSSELQSLHSPKLGMLSFVISPQRCECPPTLLKKLDEKNVHAIQLFLQCNVSLLLMS